jgi:hypothetical protein
MNPGITIRPFAEEDATPVHELFIMVNRLLSPPDMRDTFESYIGRSLTEEIDRIVAYYTPTLRKPEQIPCESGRPRFQSGHDPARFP